MATIQSSTRTLLIPMQGLPIGVLHPISLQKLFAKFSQRIGLLLQFLLLSRELYGRVWYERILILLRCAVL